MSRKSSVNPMAALTTVTIEKPGNLTEVPARAGGKDPYVWAQEYVNELNRKKYSENEDLLSVGETICEKS